MVVALIIVIALAIVAGPYFTIEALNCLFNTGIEFNFWTWLSAFWLGCLVYGSGGGGKSS